MSAIKFNGFDLMETLRAGEVRKEKKNKGEVNNTNIPVTRSHTNILVSARPDTTQPSTELMANATVSHPGFHFLNNVPD